MCSLLFQFTARHKIPAIFLKHFFSFVISCLDSALPHSFAVDYVIHFLLY